MSRPLRIEFDGAVYHVMARGVGRMRTFVDDDDRRRFLDIVGEIVGRGDWVIHAFCLMPNHYHLLCQTPYGGLSRWMQTLNGSYSRYFNRRRRRVGHLWQGRFKAILVEDGSYFLECGRYIHGPTYAILLQSAWNRTLSCWKFSSARGGQDKD